MACTLMKVGRIDDVICNKKRERMGEREREREREREGEREREREGKRGES